MKKESEVLVVQIEEKSNTVFVVTVEEKGYTTTHTVTFDDEYYHYLVGDAISKKNVIKRSFEFLLQRESNRTILSQFDLRVINRYFPEYEKIIKIISKKPYDKNPL